MSGCRTNSQKPIYQAAERLAKMHWSGILHIEARLESSLPRKIEHGSILLIFCLLFCFSLVFFGFFLGGGEEGLCSWLCVYYYTGCPRSPLKKEVVSSLKCRYLYMLQHTCRSTLAPNCSIQQCIKLMSYIYSSNYTVMRYTN